MSGFLILDRGEVAAALDRPELVLLDFWQVPCAPASKSGCGKASASAALLSRASDQIPREGREARRLAGLIRETTPGREVGGRA